MNGEEKKISQSIPMDNQMLIELAEDTMVSMSAKIFRDLMKEKGNENPDQKIITQLTNRILELEQEKRELIRTADKETMRNCIDKYSPILREEFSKEE